MKLLRLVLLVIIASTGAHAYVLNGPKWPTPTVTFYVNPVSQDLPEADVIAAVKAGAAAWAQAQSGANLQPTYAGTTTGSALSRNFKNEVFFRNVSGGSLYGETQWWYDGSNHLIDFDVLFYDEVKFFTGTAGCADGVYLEDATAHEFGHGIGFGHSEVEGATMVHWMPYCSMAWRTLHDDDIAGLKILYPPTTTPPPPPPPDPTPIPPPPTSGFMLMATGIKVKGLQQVALIWSGSTAQSIDVYRDTVRITTTANDGSHTDFLNRRGSGRYTYVVCEAQTVTCASAVSVTF